MENIHIRLQDINKQYGELVVLKELNHTVQKGEFVAIVGKSGCGKSTLLRLIAGLEEASKGSIEINGRSLNGLNKEARMMFQDGRLLPWKRVIDNVGVGLKGKWKDRAITALQNVGLQEKVNEWPTKLSGGQKQRVALARALVHQPSLLLLDEPLGALDALTRLEMQDLIESIWQKHNFTSILVTHDVEEAVALADRVLLIEAGQIVLNKVIDLPRPRQRSQPAFSLYVEEILDQIMDRTKSKTTKVIEYRNNYKNIPLKY